MNPDTPTPRYSVVIPLYNKAPLIAATLESVLANGESSLEILVIDDGSTDDSAAVVEGFDDPRIRLIRQANGGVSRARNRGLDEARGEWVAFLDADDLWAPTFLARLDDLAAAHPDCEMIATGYRTDDAGDSAHRHFLNHPRAAELVSATDGIRVDDYLSFVAEGQLCCTISTVLSRSLVERHGLRFPEGEHLGEDLDFFLRAADHATLAFTPEPLAIYVQSPRVARLSKVRAPAFVPAFLDRLEQRLSNGAIRPDRVASARRYLVTKYEVVLMMAVNDGRRGVAARILAKPVMRERRLRWLGLLAYVTLPAGWADALKQWRRQWAGRYTGPAGSAGIRPPAIGAVRASRPARTAVVKPRIAGAP